MIYIPTTSEEETRTLIKWHCKLLARWVKAGSIMVTKEYLADHADRIKDLVSTLPEEKDSK